MTDQKGEIRSPAAEKESRVARLRSLEDAITFSATGHAAALYEARAKAAVARAEARPGFGLRVKRIVDHLCRNCGGLGIKYVLDEQRFTITISECYCAKYEVHYVREQESSQHLQENPDGKQEAGRNDPPYDRADGAQGVEAEPANDLRGR